MLQLPFLGTGNAALTPACAVLPRARRQRVGAKIQCTSCYTAYHPLCARIAGLHMEILDGTESNPDAPVRPSSPLFFPLHACSLGIPASTYCSCWYAEQLGSLSGGSS
jgi:hypothetical protein